MTVRQIQCTLFTSNIYVLEEGTSESVWLIDCGDGNIEIPEGKIVKGVFITHSHVDHIVGLNMLLERFPLMVVYTSVEGRDGLFDCKKNLSFYHEMPFIYNGDKINILHEGDEVELFNNLFLTVIETPGHNPACLSFSIENYLFTGDSLVPGHPVVTKLKGGNKAQAENSLERLNRMIKDDTKLCSGHGVIIDFTKG